MRQSILPCSYSWWSDVTSLCHPSVGATVDSLEGWVRFWCEVWNLYETLHPHGRRTKHIKQTARKSKKDVVLRVPNSLRRLLCIRWFKCQKRHSYISTPLVEVMGTTLAPFQSHPDRATCLQRGYVLVRTMMSASVSKEFRNRRWSDNESAQWIGSSWKKWATKISLSTARCRRKYPTHTASKDVKEWFRSQHF